MDIKSLILIGGGLLIAAVIGHGFWIAWRSRREPYRLDIVPDLSVLAKPVCLNQIFAPSRLTAIGPAVLSTGGAVSNTGLAMLGVLRCASIS